MGLWEKVTITLVIIALIQIACRHCMPRTPRKASLKRYLNDLKPVKNNPVPTPYFPARANKKLKQTFGNTAQNGRIGQGSLPKKSLYKTYNFPETEYPLDNSPRDPFHIGMHFNENNNVNTLQKACNLQSSAISDMKKEMKMKRKLLSTKQGSNGNIQLKTDISSIKSSSNPDLIRLLDSETFPKVQYPLNTMDTWGPNYWNYLPFTQERSFHKFGQLTFNPQAKEDINEPFTRLTKAKASKYLQSYDKLKEENRRTKTENSKRSNVGQKGLNFTKTVTCEKVSDDFMTAGLISNIPGNSTEIKKALTLSAKITTSSENTCPVTDYPYHPMPIPYKVIEENTENFCPADELKNKTKELQDVDNSVIAQTLQLIQEILFNDDTSSTVLPGNSSKEIEKNMNTSDSAVVSANKDISTTLMDSAKSCTVFPTEELSQEVSNDAPVCNLRKNMTSFPAELIPENTATVAGPLNVKMPLPFSEPITYEALKNALNPGYTLFPNGNVVPASTSIIIIPFNNNSAGKSQSHMLGTSPDTPIIVYIPSTHSSDNPSQPSPLNKIVSSSIDRSVPNNQLYNVISNMAPVQVDNPFSTTLVSELLNSNSDSGSSLPIHEMLPTNSMCYNNESSPSSMREKPISDILIDRSLTDDEPFVTTTWDVKLSKKPTETGDLDVDSDILPPISNVEHPIFDFSGSEFTSLSHGPYNNVLNNELPMITREIDSNQEIFNVSSKDLFISRQNTKLEQLLKAISMDSVSKDSLSEISNDVPPVALDKNNSSVTSTDSIEILKTNAFLPETIPNLQEAGDIPTTILLLPTDASLTSAPLSETVSDEYPEQMDAKLETTQVLNTATDSTPQHIGNTHSPPILNSSPMMTDMTLKTELYKIRHILDKVLSTEIPTYSQPTPINTKLLPISDSDSLLLPINETPTETLPMLAVDKTQLPLPATDSPIDSLRQMHEAPLPISVNETPTNTLPLSGNDLVIPNELLETDIPSLPIDETVHKQPTLVSHPLADNKPYLLDNIVAPLSETFISRTKDTSDKGLSHNVDDVPLKMDLKFPDIYEVSSDDLPLSVDNLPTNVYPGYTTIPGASTNNLPTQGIETLTPVSEVPVRDLLKPTDVFSVLVDEVSEGASPEVLTDSVKTSMSDSFDKLLQDFPSFKVPSDGLPSLPMDEFKLSIHETLPDGQFNKISSKGPPQKVYLPLSVQKIIPDLSLSDSLTNEPSFKDYLPSPVIDKNIELAYPTADTKDLPLAVEHLLSPKKYETPDSLLTDIPSIISLPTNLERLQSTNPDKTSDEVLSESTLSDLPREDLLLPEDKMLPIIDHQLNHLSLLINKTPSTSKLPIAKALLENILSDITKGDLSSIVAKDLPITPHSLLDKTVHYVDVKSPLSETKDITLPSVEKFFPNSGHTDNMIDNVPSSKKLEDTTLTDLHSELPLSMDEMHKDKPYIPTDDVEDHDKNEIKYLDDPNHDLLEPKDRICPPKDTTQTPSSLKLPISKALLVNVLTDITTKGLSVPVTQSVPVTSSSVLDKTLYYVESSISHNTENSTSLPIDKILPKKSLSDHPTDNLPISTEDTLSLPIDKTFSELQSLDIPKELSSPIDNIRQDILNISMYDEEQGKNENLSSDTLADDLSLPMETPTDTSLSRNKPPLSPKLQITKALLENILSGINTRGSSLPVAKAHPVTPRSQLDKTLYFLESPVSDMTKKSSVIPTVNLPSSEIDEDVSQQPIDKTLPYNPTLDIPTHNLQKDKINYSEIFTDDVEQEDKCEILSDVIKYRDESDNPINIEEHINIFGDLSNDVVYNDEDILTDNLEDNDKSVNLTDNVEVYDNNETQSLDHPTHDLLVPIDKVSPPKDTTKTTSSLKLPITKAILENALTDITTKGFLRPVAQSVPVESPSVIDKTIYHVESSISHNTEKKTSLMIDKILPNTSLSDHPSNYLPISTKDSLLLPIDKKKSQLQGLDISTELSSPIDNICPDIPYISKYDAEQGENKNLSSDNLTDDLSLLMEFPSETSLSRNKPPLSSKLPITEALLEHVLSDTRGFSLPVAKAHPVTPRSHLNKTLYYLESPVTDMTRKNYAIPTDNFPSTIINDDVPPRPTDKMLPDHPIFLGFPTDKLLIYKIHNSDILTDDVKQEDKSDILTEDKSDSITDSVENRVTSNNLTDDVEDDDEDKSDILTNDLEDNDKSVNLTDGVEDHDKNGTPIDKVSPPKKTKTTSSSQLPITKALLENVLSDIITRGFSISAAQPFHVPSLIDNTLYYIESPNSHITEDSCSLPVDKILPKSSLSDYPPDSLLIPTEDTLPLPDEKTFSELHRLDIPALSSAIDSIRPDIPTITMYDKEQDEIENPSSEIFTADLSSASPMEVLHSLSKYMPSDLPLLNIKTPPSSKLPITKALLENVLSDINTRGFSFPVAKAHPVPRSQLDKKLSFVESPFFDKAEKSSVIPADNFSSSGINVAVPDNLLLDVSTDKLLIDKIGNTDILTDDLEHEDKSAIFTDDVEDRNVSDHLTDVGEDKDQEKSVILINDVEYSKISDNLTYYIKDEVNSDILTDNVKQEQISDILTVFIKDRDKSDNLIDNVEHGVISVDLTDDVENEDKSDILTNDLEDNDKSINLTDVVEDHDKNGNQSLNNPTYNLPVPVDKVSPPKDTTKTPSSSKLPITKALLENVLLDIITRGFSVSAAQSFNVPSVLDNTLSYIESPVSHITEDTCSLPVDKILPKSSLSDYPTDSLLIPTENSLPLPDDKMFSELHSLDIPALSSPIDSIRPDIPTITMYDKEQDEIENPSSEIFTADLSSASPMEVLHSVSKYMPSDLPLLNIKTPPSSKLPITKALLENVLSDINTRGFSFPVAKAHPVPRSQLDKKLSFVESPVFDKAEKSSVIPADNFSSSGINVAVPDNLLLDVSTDKLLIDKIGNTDILTDDLEHEDKSAIFTDDVEDRNVSDHLTDVGEDKDQEKSDILIDHVEDSKISDNLTDVIEGRNISDILTYYVKDEVNSDILTDNVKQEHKSDILTVFIKDRDKSDNLIDNVEHGVISVDLTDDVENEDKSDILTNDLKDNDKSVNLTDVVEDHDKNGHQSLNNPTYNLPVPIDNVSPPKDTTKTPSSSKLPITKALLENVLSDINTRGLSFPVAKAHPVPRSQLDKKLSFVESPVFDKAEKSSVIPADNFSSSGINVAVPDNLILDNSTDKLLIDKIDNTDILTDDVEHEDKSAIFTDDVEDRNVSNYLTDVVEDKDQEKSVILIDDVEDSKISDNLTDVIEGRNISDILTYYVKDEVNSDILTDNVKQEHKSDILTVFIKDRDKSDNLIDNVEHGSVDLTDDIENEDKSDILTNDLEDNDKFVNLTDIVEDHDKNGHQSLKNPTYNLPVPIDKVSPPKDTTETISSSKLPITKALLENVLSDIITRGFSVSPAQSFNVPSMLDNTLSYIESPISHITEDTCLLPVDKILPKSSLSDYPTDSLLIPTEDTLPLPEDKTFSELHSLDITTLSSSIDSIRPDIPTVTMYDKEQDEIENPSSEIFTADLSSASPMEVLHSLSKYMPSDLPLLNIKTPPSSKLPITKALLENVLSDINTRGLSFPVAKAHPVTRSQLDKKLSFVESPVFDKAEKSSVIPADNFSWSGINVAVPDNLILDISTDKLLIDKIDNTDILTDDVEHEDKSAIFTDDVEDRNVSNYLTDVVEDKDQEKSVILIDDVEDSKISDNLTDVIEGRNISDILTYYVKDEVNSDILTDNVKQEHKSDILTVFIKDRDKSDNLIDNVEHGSVDLTDDIENEDKSDILTNDLEDNDKSVNLTDIVEDHDKNGHQSLKNPTYNLPVPIDKVSPPKDTTKTPSSSKLPITKALLENVLSDIITRGFSISPAQSFNVPSMLDNTLSYIESPISHITEDTCLLPVDKILPKSSLSDYPTDSLLIPTEDTLPLPEDKTFSELHSLDIPTLSSPIDSIRPDIPTVTMYDKEQDEIENPSSEIFTADLSSASPMEALLSFSKDMASDLTLPNIKTPPSSKLPITKALLENVLSDINSRGFSFPVAKAHPVTPRSQLDKTLSILESPVLYMAEKSSVIPTDNFPSTGINKDIPDNLILDIPTDKLLMDKIHNTDNLADDVEGEDLDKSDILIDDVEYNEKSINLTEVVEGREASDILTDYVKDKDKSEILSDHVEDRDKSNNLTDDIEIEDSNEALFSDDPSDDYLASRIPITKALLEKVLSDITDAGIP